MSTLGKGDFGVAPLHLMRGRKVQEQMILLYAWQAVMAGEDWSLSGVAKEAGCSPSKPALDAMIGDGLISEVSEDERAGQKTSQKYRFNCDFIPERSVPEKVAEKPLKGPRYQGWVFTCIKAWSVRGVQLPYEINNTLKKAVQEKGEEFVVAALERYAKSDEGKFGLKHFAANIEKWAPRQARGNRSFGDV